MNTTDAGRLGEVKIMARLTELGWFPFTDLSGKCLVDIIAWRSGVTRTFQVKTTETMAPSGNFTVQIGSIRPNRTGNTIKKFDNKSVDYLAVYIVPLDMVQFIAAATITTGRTVTVARVHSGIYPE